MRGRRGVVRPLYELKCSTGIASLTSKPHLNSERDAGVLLVLMGLRVEDQHQLAISP